MSRQSTSAINTQLQLYMPGITILKNDFTKKKNRKKKGRNLKKKFHVRHNENDEAFFM